MKFVAFNETFTIDGYVYTVDLSANVSGVMTTAQIDALRGKRIQVVFNNRTVIDDTIMSNEMFQRPLDFVHRYVGFRKNFK